MVLNHTNTFVFYIFCLWSQQLCAQVSLRWIGSFRAKPIHQSVNYGFLLFLAFALTIIDLIDKYSSFSIWFDSYLCRIFILVNLSLLDNNHSERLLKNVEGIHLNWKPRKSRYFQLTFETNMSSRNLPVPGLNLFMKEHHFDLPSNFPCYFYVTYRVNCFNWLWSVLIVFPP